MTISGSDGIGKTFFSEKVIEKAEALEFDVIQSMLTAKETGDSLGFFKSLLDEESQKLFEQKMQNFNNFKRIENFEDTVFEIITELIIQKAEENSIMIV
jgi:nucleoside-triphosphatase THEP1